MEVEKVQMDEASARAALADYRMALRRRYDEEYEAVAQGLEAMTMGQAVINLQDVIRDGGFDEFMRPRLAIARADRRIVRFSWLHRDTFGRFDSRSPNSHATSDTLQVWFEFGQRHDQQKEKGAPVNWTNELEGWALVPMVPPAGLRAIRGGSYLRNHFILWEVEEWANKPLQVIPDRDPLLLKHLGGDLYAVVYEWDLTDLERAVMAGRRNG